MSSRIPDVVSSLIHNVPIVVVLQGSCCCSPRFLMSLSGVPDVPDVAVVVLQGS